MAASITKINKKLASLKSAKAKEEKRAADAIEKLTAKYHEDLNDLKETYEAKVKEQKDLSASRLGEINPEIDFYTKQKIAIEKLQAQLENLDKATDERMKSKQDEKEEAIEETIEEEFVEEEVVEDETLNEQEGY